MFVLLDTGQHGAHIQGSHCIVENCFRRSLDTNRRTEVNSFVLCNYFVLVQMNCIVLFIYIAIVL